MCRNSNRRDLTGFLHISSGNPPGFLRESGQKRPEKARKPGENPEKTKRSKHLWFMVYHFLTRKPLSCHCLSLPTVCEWQLKFFLREFSQLSSRSLPDNTPMCSKIFEAASKIFEQLSNTSRRQLDDISKKPRRKLEEISIAFTETLYGLDSFIPCSK